MSQQQIGKFKDYFRSQTSEISKRNIYESKIKKEKQIQIL